MVLPRYYICGREGNYKGMGIKTIIIFYYIIMNFIGLFIMKADKNKAIHHKYRIPEKTLWLVALLGGAIGTSAGMKLFHHKTKHLSFSIGFPILAVVEMCIFVTFLL